MTAHDTPRSTACIFTTQSHPRGLIIKVRALHPCMHLTQHLVPSEKDQKQKPLHTLRGVLMPVRASSDNHVQKEHQYSNSRNRKDTSLYLPDQQIFHYILQQHAAPHFVRDQPIENPLSPYCVTNIGLCSVARREVTWSKTYEEQLKLLGFFSLEKTER